MVAVSDLPILSIQSLLSFQRVAVIAPHPDDETLGCGGAIALLRQHHISVEVLVISDGTGSHPNSKTFPPQKLRELREQEARLALSRLGVAADCITFFRWRDTAVPHPGDRDFAKAVENCNRVLQRYQPELIFLPWQRDRHCDHQAAWQIVQSCLKSWTHRPRQLVYSIWGSAEAGLTVLPEGEKGWRLDIRSVRSLKRDAAMMHRSQTTALIQDDPDGFRLTAQMLNNLIQPYEVYLEVS